MDNLKKEQKQVNFRMPLEDYEKIVKLGELGGRNPSAQIRYMLNKYIEMIEPDINIKKEDTKQSS